MEVPKYLQVLWAGRWLMAVGIVVGAVAAFFAGFTVQNGEILQRASQSYSAGTTVLLSSQTQPLYQAVIPGQELVEGVTAPEAVDLTSKAILYAYLISGEELRAKVEAQVGAFAPTDALTALRRTTQPAGDESFGGRYSLPIIEVAGVSEDPARAELISRTATALFQQQVIDEQTATQMPETDRVLLSTLDEKSAVAEEGSNPAIPVVVTFIGVFLLFAAAVYIIAGARASRPRKRRTPAPALAAPAAVAAEELPRPAEVEAAPVARPARSRRPAASAKPRVEAADADVESAEPAEPARAR